MSGFTSGKHAIIAEISQLFAECWARSVVPVLAVSSSWDTGGLWMTAPSWGRYSGMRYPSRERTAAATVLAAREVKLKEKVKLYLSLHFYYN